MNALKIAWAHVRLKAYLLFLGMWRGECGYAHYGPDGELSLLAASKTTNVQNGQWFGTTRVFYRRVIK